MGAGGYSFGVKWVRERDVRMELRYVALYRCRKAWKTHLILFRDAPGLVSRCRCNASWKPQWKRALWSKNASRSFLTFSPSSSRLTRLRFRPTYIQRIRLHSFYLSLSLSLSLASLSSLLFPLCFFPLSHTHTYIAKSEREMK